MQVLGGLTISTKDEWNKEPCSSSRNLVRMDAGANKEEKNKDNSRKNRRIVSIEFETRSFSSHDITPGKGRISIKNARGAINEGESNCKRLTWL